MSATLSIFVCQACGHRSAKWLGRCPECEAWSSFVEERERPAARKAGAGARAAHAVALAEIEREAVARAPSGLAAVDRVLGGGVVGGVEVSIAGGATWHPAEGTTRWSYSWTPATGGTPVIRVRAVDDSGNIETAAATRSSSLR